jgi:NADH-quinone oxidoreductase subunit M
MTVRDGLVLVPLVAVILFFAVYPQLALHKGERTIARSIVPAVQQERAASGAQEAKAR